MGSVLAGIRGVRRLAYGALAALCIAGCGAGSVAHGPTTTIVATSPATATQTGTSAATATQTGTSAATNSHTVATPPPPPYPRLLSTALATQPTGLVPVGTWQGQTSAWIARSPAGVALLSFNQRLLQLHLHSGSTDAGASGWRFGPVVAGSETRHLVAAFNGAFKFSTGSGGFVSYGRVAVPLQHGLGSVVTYADGTTDIGSWGSEVPAQGRPLASVRQNLALLIDNGSAAANLDCVTCWGATLGGVVDPARSALGITADGRLVWAGGEHLTVSGLANALLAAGVVRAVELDINPFWVAGYLYGHRGGKGPLAPVPVVPGQSGIAGQYLTPWTRDFFTVVTR